MRRNVTVKVQFFSESLTGTVFCASLSTPPQNTNIIKMAAMAGQSMVPFQHASSGNYTATVTVAGLNPSTRFNVYCYVENLKSIGRVSMNCYCN